MTSVKLRASWTDENAIIEGVRIYKSDQAFTSTTRPQLLVEITDGSLFYEDFDVEENQTWYYMLSCYLDQQEVFTECFKVDVELSAVDPQFNSVKLLMQFDGNTPLVDQKTSAQWQLFGDASIEAVTSKTGVLHVSDAATSYAKSSILTNLYAQNVAGKELTIEFFFKKTSAIGNAGALSFQNAVNLSERCSFFMRAGSNNFNCAAYTSQNNAFTFLDVAAGVNLNEWVHYAYVEHLGVAKLYINGIQKASYGGTPVNLWDNTVVTIGQNGNGGESFGGYIDGLRVSKTARYKSNFVPPDLPLPSR